MIRYLLLIISCLLIGCSPKLSNEAKVSYQLINSYAKEVKNKDNLILAGSGISNEMGKYKSLHMYFYANNALNVDDARKLFLIVVENFIKKINSDSRFEHIMTDYPVSIKNVKFSISFVDQKFDPLPSRCIGLVYNSEDMILYSVWDDTKPTAFANGSFVDVFRETYDQALIAIKEGTSLQDYLSNPR